MTVMNQKGFTLLESLTVLMIGSIMLSLLFAALPPVYEKRVVQHFVSQLEEDLLYAQQTALVRHATVKVQFDFAGCRYIIKHADEGSSPKLVRTYSCHIAFKKRRSSELLLLTQAEFRIKGENRDRYTARLFCTDDLFRKRKD